MADRTWIGIGEPLHARYQFCQHAYVRISKPPPGPDGRPCKQPGCDRKIEPDRLRAKFCQVCAAKRRREDNRVNQRRYRDRQDVKARARPASAVEFASIVRAGLRDLRKEPATFGEAMKELYTLREWLDEIATRVLEEERHRGGPPDE